VGDPLAFLRTAEAGVLVLVTGAGAVTWTRLFPDVKTDEARWGIVSLQLAFTPAKARAILESWRARHLGGAAQRSLFVDVPYIVLYAWALGALATLAGRAAAGDGLLSPRDAATAAAWLAIGAWVAAFCDLVENVGLWFQIAKGLTALTIPTSVISTVKWALALGSLLASISILLASI
jgi:hypothetical protein